ncbi:MAG: protein jag [Candidatus Omnitrophota bacterium]|jgi:spoIIIJ-associated protein|nr:MAG: protein jag [Candidatus Omnitrophota bacterium]
MKEAIGSGITMDEAVQDALKHLSAEREEVEIYPLDVGKKGFLGIGKRPAQVKAILRQDDRIRTIVFLRNILAYMNIDTKMEVREEDSSLVVVLGEEAAPLIGHRGQTLDSLQYLVARYLNEDREDWRKVIIDIDNYRDRREDDLQRLAERLAEQVIRTKRDVRTEPLTAPERRIIHMTLKENTAVTTFSIGEGARKRVVIASAERSDPSRRRQPRRGGGGGGSGRPPRSGPGKGPSRGGYNSSRKRVARTPNSTNR